MVKISSDLFHPQVSRNQGYSRKTAANQRYCAGGGRDEVSEQLLVLIISAMSVGSQVVLAQGGHGHEMIKQEQKNEAVVNSTCPITGGEIDLNNVPKELTRVFHDQTVGFCCAGCPEKWNNLSESQKEQKLESSTKKK